MRRTIRVVAVGSLMTLGACASARPDPDPMSQVRDSKLSTAARIKAIDRRWASASEGARERQAAREDLKTVAGPGAWPAPLRLAAMRALADDRSEQGEADTKRLAILMLPRETDPGMTTLLSGLAAERGWTDATPALVRSLGRWNPRVADTERPEAKAIRTLNPDRPLAEVVWGVFVAPPEERSTLRPVSAERIRADAWDLLSRLDPTGDQRAAWLSTAPEEATGAIADLRACVRDLRCAPLTGDELRWLGSLRDFTKPANRSWWEAATAAVGSTDPERTGRLQLRHIAAIHWAAAHGSPWLSADRATLLAELKSKLASRPVHRRVRGERESRAPSSERLADVAATISWGDLLVALVVDKSLGGTRLARTLRAQAEMDREDTSAEYGGLLVASPPNADPPFNAVLYPPRPGDRRGDREFVASADMIAQSDHALAHYHYHAQKARNVEYAGPSQADILYAARLGRACVVFTSIRADTLNADLYLPGGEVIDLGTVVSP
ncbi:MAG: hypothetical protein JNM80_11145 [Phycisphaerae bacterium]|nr:hypothetical protein [Phycisphaerae bacterium]